MYTRKDFKKGPVDRLKIGYNAPKNGEDTHLLRIHREMPKFEMNITTTSVGINVSTMGIGVKTNADKDSRGRYPVVWTLPGEVNDERIKKIIGSTLEKYLSEDTKEMNNVAENKTYGDKYINSDAVRRLEEGLTVLLPFRGRMDEKKEIPQEFIDSCTDHQLKIGIKGKRISDISSHPKSGASNWSRAIVSDVFFKNMSDARSRIEDKDFRAIVLGIMEDRIPAKIGKRQIYAKHQLRTYIDVDTSVRLCIEKKIFKEKLWGDKHWREIMPHFSFMYTSGIITSKTLSSLLNVDKDKEDKPVFFPVLMRHGHEIMGWPKKNPIRCEYREKFFNLLVKWPKTQAMGKLLDEAMNKGVPIEMIVDKNISTRGAMEDLIALAKEAAKSGKKTMDLNSSYKPPEIDLKDKKLGLTGDWDFADYKTFPMLGHRDNYNCCISSAGHYMNKIIEGKAFVAYLIDRTSYPEKREEFDANAENQKSWGDIGRGAVCFFTHTENNEWKVDQMKAYSNREPHEIYKKEAKLIAQAVTKSHPEIYEVVEQVESDIKENEIQKYLSEHFRIQQRNSLNRELSLTPEMLDKELDIVEEREELIQKQEKSTHTK